jgi:diaminohydroxyphosphoribosylaminopyrimidine deaminase/5-amino-6-(5-phosphoribosylamino)uracil reductase
MRSVPIQTYDTWSARDLAFMDLALEQARLAAGRTAPNPAVGAVIVRGNEVLGRGATQPPPGQHAEIVALEEAGEAVRGAELFVTLEPCAHHGNTPPCAEAVIAAGVRRVVVGTLDPNPLVNGAGARQLAEAGITVDVGCRRAQSQEQIAGFTSRLRLQRPRVTAKYAMTLDGKIATRTGHARWISSPESRADAHRFRDRVDAIIVGVGTVLADDPLLTTRLPAEQCGYGGPHQPLRVILDSRLRTPPSANMLATETPGTTRIYTASGASPERRAALEAAGASVVEVAACEERVAPAAVLADLAELGINDALIEGGASIHGAFIDAGLVDRVQVYVAPLLVGGQAAPGPVAGAGVGTMPEARRLRNVTTRQVGPDLLIEGDIAAPEGGADV